MNVPRVYNGIHARAPLVKYIFLLHRARIYRRSAAADLTRKDVSERVCTRAFIIGICYYT